MLIRLFELVLIVGLVYTFFRWGIKAWKKADVQNTVDNIETLEENYEVVNLTNKTHKNIKEKKNAINKFNQ